MTQDATTIAVLGLGAMGSGMARNLADAGRRVTVWNRTPARADDLAAAHAGIEAAPTPRMAAAGADVVVSVVTDDDAARVVWLDPTDGAAAGLRAGAVAVESSTVTPGWVAELGAAIAAVGADLVECPVLGSRPQLARGALVHLLGGDDGPVATARAALAPNASAARHLGRLGSAAPVKLAVNALLAAQVAIGAEIVAVLDGHGFDHAAARDLLRDLPVTSAALGGVLDRFASGDHAPNFPVDLVAKDLRYFVGLVPDPAAVPVAAAVGSAFAAASVEGLGGDDLSSIIRLRGPAGVAGT
ncbi:MAG: NAD(P)-binding domain-containing protein [Actinomycetota bacterium]|nr:NAD(P)-binding domain-containing protein [Actinomycetota bacterium]